MAHYIIRAFILTPDGRFANDMVSTFTGQLSLTGDAGAVNAAYGYIADDLRRSTGSPVAVTSITEVKS